MCCEMKLKVKLLGITSGGKPIVILNSDDAEELGLKGMDRVILKYDKSEITAIVNISSQVIKKGEIGVYEELDHIKLKEGKIIDVEVAPFPKSLQYVKEKLSGRRLSYEEMEEIVKDTIKGNLTDIEIASFVTALHFSGLDMEEATNLSLAMVKTGETLDLKKKIIVDKHSIGSAVGDKTSLILVPLIASSGLTIPKTSSRAITSACGTADRAEVLMPVDLSIEEMKKVVEKTYGCIVWGGALHLAPADDIFIKIEHPLEIDPLLFPSIMAKKKAVNATHLVIDIPCGRWAKVKTLSEANNLARDFIELGKRLGIKTKCAITNAEEPIGYAIGPALEAREVLQVLEGRNIPDLIDKVCSLAKIIFQMTGKNFDPRKILRSGKVRRKLIEIINEQGGNGKIKSKDIEFADYRLDLKAKEDGLVFWIDNYALVQIARAAGAPKDKKAGLLLYKKIGDRVRKGEKILTIFSEKNRKLKRAEKILENIKIFGIGKSEIVLKEVKKAKEFILER
ncbi:MAG: AMP phosphorylase [Candidatus Aenigmatarchaeota archaeon]